MAPAMGLLSALTAKLLVVAGVVVMVVVMDVVMDVLMVVVMDVVMVVVRLVLEVVEVEVQGVVITGTFPPSFREENVAVRLRLTLKTCSSTSVKSSELGTIQFALKSVCLKLVT